MSSARVVNAAGLATVDGVPLRDRYPDEAARILPAWLRARLGADAGPDAVAWEVLYRLEPHLFERLIAGETLHPGVLAWLAGPFGRAVEVGVGTGRLTVHLASRCTALVAVDAAASMIDRLEARLRRLPGGCPHVRPAVGDAAALPVASGWADAVFTCATLSRRPPEWADRCLGELERVCRPGGLVTVVWPHTPRWLRSRGYTRVVFPGPMAHEFASAEEAVELARIFYPDRVAAVAALRSACVPYDVLGINAPRDLAWKVVG